MDVDEVPFRVRGRHNEVLGEGIWVVGKRCMHCGASIGERLCLALAKPYYGLLHSDCVPHFNYNRTWSHPRPIMAYANEIAFPMLE